MAYNADGDPDTALRLASDAMAGGLPSDSTAPGTVYIAAGNAKTVRGEMDEARRLIAQGVDALEANEADPLYGVVLTCVLAIWETMAGDLDRARELVTPMVPVARRRRNPSALAIALYAFGWASWQHDPDAALAALEESAELTRNGATESTFGPCLAETARLLAKRGDLEGSFAPLREAITHTYQVADYSELVGVLWVATTVLADAGRAEATAVINGFITDGPVADFAIVYQGPERDEQVQAQERARAELGDATYDAAHARGAAMSYEEIVDLVLAALAPDAIETADD
jgi:ATP/maltotriose-dependent transcriptional regulator MalT